MATHQHSNQTAKSATNFDPSEAEGRTDRQKERERQSASAYQWRVGAECSPAAPRLPAALSTSPADAGPPRSRSCPSTTGNPVENTAHLLKNTALLTQILCYQGPLLNTWLCLLLSTPQPGKHRCSNSYWNAVYISLPSHKHWSIDYYCSSSNYIRLCLAESKQSSLYGFKDLYHYGNRKQVRNQ